MNETVRKVLVAVDLSPASDAVMAAARQVGVATGAEMVVLHCAEPDPDFVGFEAGPPAVRDQVAKEYRREHGQVQSLARQLRDAGIQARGLLAQGPIVQTTLRQSANLKADLVITGSHGHSAFYDALVGSYSAAILRKSKVPVLVVPTHGVH